MKGMYKMRHIQKLKLFYLKDVQIRENLINNCECVRVPLNIVSELQELKMEALIKIFNYFLANSNQHNSNVILNNLN